jgi:hypothetical protein
VTEMAPEVLREISGNCRWYPLTREQVFGLWKCAVKDDDKLVDAIIEKLYREMIAFDLARAERVMELIVERDDVAEPALRGLLQDITITTYRPGAIADSSPYREQ